MQYFHARFQKLSRLYATFMLYWRCRLNQRQFVAGVAGGKKDTLIETQIVVQGDSTRITGQVKHANQFEFRAAAALTKGEISAFIEDTGVIPSMSEVSAEDALFIAEALIAGGIPIAEISMNDPEAIDVISHLVKSAPTMIVGAGNIRTVDAACKCVDAGAKFLTTDGAIPGVVEFAAEENLVAIPGALTPTEVISLWHAGADFVKVVPCSAMGGYKYIQSLKAAVPPARLIASGGVNQVTALNYVTAGVAALSVGKELVPTEAIALRQARRIQELARRFLTAVDKGRR
jgi:2-dehydro-3-deoxyphosphogluconate aldolase / (4S)-4-hydroxy-2-oxoglutarate aldolase